MPSDERDAVASATRPRAASSATALAVLPEAMSGMNDATSRRRLVRCWKTRRTSNGHFRVAKPRQRSHEPWGASVDIMLREPEELVVG